MLGNDKCWEGEKGKRGIRVKTQLGCKLKYGGQGRLHWKMKVSKYVMEVRKKPWSDFGKSILGRGNSQCENTWIDFASLFEEHQWSQEVRGGVRIRRMRWSCIRRDNRGQDLYSWIVYCCVYSKGKWKHCKVFLEKF